MKVLPFTSVIYIIRSTTKQGHTCMTINTTRARDKHGRQIREGDILRFVIEWADGDGYETTQPVEIIDGELYLGKGYRRQFYEGLTDEYRRENPFPLSDTYHEKYGEIVGSIREHAELLVWPRAE